MRALPTLGCFTVALCRSYLEWGTTRLDQSKHCAFNDTGYDGNCDNANEKQNSTQFGCVSMGSGLRA